MPILENSATVSSQSDSVDIGAMTEEVIKHLCTVAVDKCQDRTTRRRAGCGGEAMRKRLLIKNFVTHLMSVQVDDEEEGVENSAVEQPVIPPKPSALVKPFDEYSRWTPTEAPQQQQPHAEASLAAAVDATSTREDVADLEAPTRPGSPEPDEGQEEENTDPILISIVVAGEEAEEIVHIETTTSSSEPRQALIVENVPSPSKSMKRRSAEPDDGNPSESVEESGEETESATIDEMHSCLVTPSPPSCKSEAVVVSATGGNPPPSPSSWKRLRL